MGLPRIAVQRTKRGHGPLANGPLASLVATHLLAVIAEYAAVVGVLVYAFERSGARGTGLASLAILVPTLVGAPIAAELTSNFRPLMVRRVGLVTQAVAYGLAAGAAAADLPVAIVVAAAVIALGAVSTLRPSGSVLLPSVVRSSRELNTATLWIGGCEGISALVGPLAAAGLLALEGPAAALAGCAAATAIALVCSMVGSGKGPPAALREGRWRPGAGMADAVRVVRGRPWALGVLGVSLARYLILGALDVLLVVLAYDALDLDGSGAGLLNALVGGGALASTAVAAMVVRRARLAPWLAAGLSVAALLSVVLGAATTLPVALVALPLLGLGASLIDGLGRMLLQRSADPRQLGSVFALIELVGGVGLILGSLLAQILVAIGDVHLALYGLGAVLVALLAATFRAVAQADEGADMPVVEMSILRQLPMFETSTPLALEAVARSAEHVRVADGTVVVTQGDPGDRFYAVASGRFDVVMSGEHIRFAERGSFFGEVALLADIPRTATVTARGPGELLAVDRVAFLIAVTGSDTSRAAAWGVVHSLRLEVDLPAA